MIEVHGERNLGILLAGRLNQVAQVDHLAVFQGAAARLNDDGTMGIMGGLHDGLDLLHIIDVERANAIAALRGFVEDLSHGYKWHDFHSLLQVFGSDSPIAQSRDPDREVRMGINPQQSPCKHNRDIVSRRP